MLDSNLEMMRTVQAERARKLALQKAVWCCGSIDEQQRCRLTRMRCPVITLAIEILEQTRGYDKDRGYESNCSNAKTGE